jgi:hypothetical protein
VAVAAVITGGIVSITVNVLEQLTVLLLESATLISTTFVPSGKIAVSLTSAGEFVPLDTELDWSESQRR